MSKTVGLILIVLGIVGIAWGGINFTTREKVVDLGPIEASHEKDHNIPIPPVAGVIALGSGVVLLLMGRR